MKRAYREDDWKVATERRAKRGAGELRVTALYVLHYADAVSPSNRWVERTEGWRSAMQLRNGSTTARQRIHHQKYLEQDFIRCWIHGTRVTDIVLIRRSRLRLLNTDNCCTCKCRYTNTDGHESCSCLTTQPTRLALAYHANLSSPVPARSVLTKRKDWQSHRQPPE
jgi:hypothetical protein